MAKILGVTHEVVRRVFAGDQSERQSGGKGVKCQDSPRVEEFCSARVDVAFLVSNSEVNVASIVMV